MNLFPFYNEDVADVFNDLRSSNKGLDIKAAEERIKEYGLNKLPEGNVDSLFTLFLRQFKSPLIYTLLAAGVVVFILDEITDALVIAFVLLFNAIIGTLQEGRAQNALLALKQFTQTSATVIREGKEIIIDDTLIVPGDLVILQEGERVPVDGRVVSSSSLTIDEAVLTGESEPVSKISETIARKELNPADQKNMVFKGTFVGSGSGTVITTATGTDTEIGKIAEKIAKIDTEIPLKKDIRFLSRIIVIVTLLLCVVIAAMGMIFNLSFSQAIATAAAVAISIIPEGLPVVMTLILALGVRRMSKQNALIKKLQAVEALGQTRVIAVDKTGTLTKNEMVVKKVYTNGMMFDVEGNGYEPKGKILFQKNIIDPLNYTELSLMGRIGALSSSAHVSFIEQDRIWKVSGDPTEAAILVFSEKIGVYKDRLEKESPKIFETPFDYKKKFHSTLHIAEDNHLLSVAGAPEHVLRFSEYIALNREILKLTHEQREELRSVFHSMARGGLRVVALAMKSGYSEKQVETLPPLTFLGFYGMKDPLRPEVKTAMRNMLSAGIRVIMITGDHLLTAEAIAKEAGIYNDGDKILTGEDIDSVNEEVLSEQLPSVKVFARVTPEHKLKIIESYRKRGEIIAMTGDGVNDAPSLVAADLGVAMGKIGTEVAKEASDIVLLDDNFGSIVSAVEEGRGIYKTIKKIILYLFSTSLGEVSTILGVLLWTHQSPLFPAQIIWLNFVTDGFLDISLAMEPKEENLLRRTFKRPKRYLLDRLMVQRIVLMAIPMTLGTVFIFQTYFSLNPEKSWTMALTALAVFQWFNAWNCKSDERSVFQKILSNKYLVAATVIVIVLQITAVYAPFLQSILKTTPLSLFDWGLAVTVGFSIIVVEEIRKYVYRKKLLP